MGEENKTLAGVVSRVSSVLGAGFGATLGAQMGDPVTGAIVGEALAQLGDDFTQRVLSPRQELRVATVLDMATKAISDGLAEGHTIRDDGFFEAPYTDASEIFEGVLLAARDEHEARKLPYFAHLLADISFDPNMTPEVANLAIQEAEQMSWLQMCLLAIVSRPEEFPLPEADTSNFARNWGDWAIGETFSKMITPEGTYLYAPTEDEKAGQIVELWDLRMNRLQLTHRAILIAAMLGLEKVPAEDLIEMWQILCRIAEKADEPSPK